jgi:hypothetical protein
VRTNTQDGTFHFCETPDAMTLFHHKNIYKRLEQSIVQAKFDQTLCDEVDKTEVDIGGELELLHQNVAFLIIREDQISVCLRYLNHFLDTRGPPSIRPWIEFILQTLGSSHCSVVRHLVPLLSTMLEKEERMREGFFEQGFLSGSTNVHKILIQYGYSNTQVWCSSMLLTFILGVLFALEPFH